MKYNLLYFGLIAAIAAIGYAVSAMNSSEGFSLGPWTASTGNGYSARGEKYDYQFPDSNTIVILGPGSNISDQCIPTVGATITLGYASINHSDPNAGAFAAGKIATGTKVTAVNTAHPRYGYGIVLTLSIPHTFPITPSGQYNLGLGYVFSFSFDKCDSTSFSRVPVVMTPRSSSSPSSSSSSRSSSSSPSSSPSSILNYTFTLPPRSY